jgi:cell division inhibitor SepF
MAGLLDKIKNMAGYEPEDPEDIEDMDDQVMDEEEYAQYANTQQAPAAPQAKPDTHERERDRDRDRSANVVSIPQRNTSDPKASLQVVLAKPETFEEASKIADNLNARRTVVLNLEGVDVAVARRIIDFLSGVAYANNGQIKRVANSTFIITPYNVNVMGDLLDELENTGMFFQS